MKYNKGGTFIEVLVILLIAGAILGAIGSLILLGIGGKEPSSGQHTGIVTSVEQNGIIWHTWSAYIKTSAQSTQEDRYCVTDPAVIAQLQADADGVKEVTVHYSNGLFVWPTQCKGADQSIITSAN